MGLNFLAGAAGLLVCNIIALPIADYFGALVFLDTLGTAIAGLVFGPLNGALLGLITNLAIGFLPKFRAYWWFFYVNIACGAAWGYASRIYPLISDSDRHIILYILVVGCVVGAISALLSFPGRILLRFDSNHLLDRVDKQIYGIPVGEKFRLTWAVLGPRELPKLFKAFSAELLLGHLLDKTISTTVAVMFLLYYSKHTGIGPNPKATYHDLVEFLAAYYYVALGFAVKTLKLNLMAEPTGEPVVALLGPLGFFGVLIAAPVLFETLGLHE